MAPDRSRTGGAAILRRAIMPALACALLLGGGPAAADQPPEPGTERPTPQDGRMRPLPPAEIDNTLAIGGEDIDASKLRSRMTVSVRVNGQGPYRFIVDSGADTSVVGLRLVEALRLPPGRPALLNTMTETAWVNRVEVDEIELGPTKVRDLELPALRERDIGAAGMIGLDALVEQRLMLDFEKRTISVDDASVRAPRLDGEIVVTARLHRGQLILTEAKAGGVSVNAVIDTGSEISIGNSALREKLLRRRKKDFDTVEVIGVTGAGAVLELAVVRELRLGPVIMRNVPIAFADVPPFEVFGLNDEPALLLGTDLMETFRKVSLDFRARKVRFQLRRCETVGLRVSTTATRIRLGSDQSVPEACRR